MYFRSTTILLTITAMKRIAIILCTLLVAALQLSAQIKTKNSRDSISINGIKFGYIYTIEQLKEALGEPTQININDPGITDFILNSPKYTLDFEGTKLKVGDSFEKVKNMPGYTSREKRYNGFHSIIFNNLMNDHSLQILFSQDEVIERISVAPRYY